MATERNINPALAVFLRDRGGKARRSEKDYASGYRRSEMRFECSPEYEAEMEKRRAEWARESARQKRAMQDARKAWRDAGSSWLPMKKCPFKALDREYGFDGTILVSDGEKRALVTVRKQWGTPIYYDEQPELVWRDGRPCLEGGKRSPKNRFPSWWYKWHLTDENGDMTYAGGEETGKESVDFVPTMWTFLPETPTSAGEE